MRLLGALYLYFVIGGDVLGGEYTWADAWNIAGLD
jgi:hypothetical protein